MSCYKKKFFTFILISLVFLFLLSLYSWQLINKTKQTFSGEIVYLPVCGPDLSSNQTLTFPPAMMQIACHTKPHDCIIAVHAGSDCMGQRFASFVYDMQDGIIKITNEDESSSYYITGDAKSIVIHQK